MSRFDQDPDYDSLVKLLIAQTKNEKLRWEPTAKENMYVCAVKGQRTFILIGSSHETAVLQVADPDGTVQFVISDTHDRVSLWVLYSLARRQAEKIDEKVHDTLKLLESL